MSVPRPVHTFVPGSPFQPGDRVVVVQAVDAEIYDVGRYVGRCGNVSYLEYECGCSQRYPDMPMVGVVVDGEIEEFWPEEIELERAEGEGRKAKGALRAT